MEAHPISDPAARAAAGLAALRAEAEARGWRVGGTERLAVAPGRVNLLGEHTDYSDGWVMPVAVDRRVACAAVRGSGGAAEARKGDALVIRSLDFDDTLRLETGRLEELRSDPARFEALAGGPATRWRRYAAGVVLELDAAGDPPGPGLVAVAGNVPLGAGLSSSAAFEAALYTALATDPAATPEAARLCRRAENRWAGVPCGIMDQFASFMGERGKVLYLDCRTLEYRLVPLPEGLGITVVDSGVRRELADSSYGERRREIETALGIIGRLTGPITALRDLPPGAFDEVEDLLPEPLRSRVAHVLGAFDRTREGIVHLALGEAAAFGRLMTACHRSLAVLFAVSTPELDLITETAVELDGVLGARLTGAGFGGCCVVLHQAGCEERLAGAVAAAYRDRFGRDPVCHHLGVADGARLLEGTGA